MFLKGILHKTLGDPGGILGDPGGSCEQAGPTQPTKTEVSCILARGIRLTCECVIILKAKLRCPSSPPEGFQNFKGGAGDSSFQSQYVKSFDCGELAKILCGTRNAQSQKRCSTCSIRALGYLCHRIRLGKVGT